jgi:hypothetical protein
MVATIGEVINQLFNAVNIISEYLIENIWPIFLLVVGGYIVKDQGVYQIILLPTWLFFLLSFVALTRFWFVHFVFSLVIINAFVCVRFFKTVP